MPINEEIITPHFERDERIKKFYERNKKIIEKLLEEEKNMIGEGGTAKVFFLDSNEDVCLKILKTGKNLPQHVPLEKELYFLSQLQDLDQNVRVPRVYIGPDYSNGDESVMKFMLMERLNAVSVAEVLAGMEKIPEGFNINSFWEQISNFLEKMHEKNIYHRDFHEGNIMIDKETGGFYVIDFGASTEAFSSEDVHEIYKKEVVVGNSEAYSTDEDMFIKVYNKLREHLKGLTSDK